MPLDTRSLLVIGAASAGWAFSFGVGTQAVSHWLKNQDINDTIIGLSHSFYYFGLAAASGVVPALARRIGPVSCAGIGMMCAGVSMILFPFGGDEWGWYFFRFVNGCAGALSLIPLETVVSRQSEPQRRTLSFGIYGFSLTLGGAIGIAAAPHFYGAGFLFTFVIGACGALPAGILVLVGLKPPTPESPVGESAPAPHRWSRSVLSYGTAWSQGFLEGGLIAFLALFLEARAYSEEAAGILVAVTTVGVIVFQVPVSWLADRLGKTPMLLACYVAAIVGLITVPLLTGTIWLAPLLFVFGAFTGAMYPLGLALLSEQTAESGIARAYAWYLAIECVGSLAGAAAMGKARDEWRPESMFTVGIFAVVAVLAAWLIVSMVLVRQQKEHQSS